MPLKSIAFLELNGLLEREGQACFGWDLDLLSFGEYLSAAADGRSRSGPDGRAPASTGECANDGPERRRAAHHLGRARAARLLACETSPVVVSMVWPLIVISVSARVKTVRPSNLPDCLSSTSFTSASAPRGMTV